MPHARGNVGEEPAFDEGDPLDAQMRNVFRDRTEAFASRPGLMDDLNSVSSVSTGHWSDFSLTGINQRPPSVVRSLGAAQLYPNCWGQDWKAPVAKLEKQLRSTRVQVGERLAELDKNLDRTFKGIGVGLEEQFSKVKDRGGETRMVADEAVERVQLLEGEVQRLRKGDTIPGVPGLSVDTRTQ